MTNINTLRNNNVLNTSNNKLQSIHYNKYIARSG